MATNLHRVGQNFVYRIGLITPQLTQAQRLTLPAKFHHLDGVDPRQSSGCTRGFEVRRLSRGEPEGVTSLYSRTSVHAYLVEVYYSSEFRPSAVDEITSQDAHDIIRALRAPSSWKGYAGSPTTEIGIRSRLETGDELVYERGLTTLQIRFATRVTEIENAS